MRTDLDPVDGVEVGDELDALVHVRLHALSGVGGHEVLRERRRREAGDLLHDVSRTERAPRVHHHELQHTRVLYATNEL